MSQKQLMKTQCALIHYCPSSSPILLHKSLSPPPHPVPHPPSPPPTSPQSFHSAGDGKLGGLVQPNDGRCHLNVSGFYDWSTKQVALLEAWPPLPGLPQSGPHQPRGQATQCKPGVGRHRRPHPALQEVLCPLLPPLTWPHRLTHMIPASVAGQISSDSSNVVELVGSSSSCFSSCSTPGEGDVPEDHDHHPGGGQLLLLRLRPLLLRL